MNRIDAKFKELRKTGRKAFIPYITAGDPDIGTTGKIVRALESAGADIIELGIPFSDPMADGPTIQRAIKRSLDNGCTVKKVFDLVRALRKDVKVPIVFMTYYNIVYSRGVERFIRDAKACGADGIIVPDLPMEESSEVSLSGDEYGFDTILLAAPTTPRDRFRKIASRSRGFIYYVSLTGVTGARKALASELKSDVIAMKKITKKPVCVGFGVSDAAQARDIASVADGVIVGSAIIKVIEKDLGKKGAIAKDVERFAASLSRAVHGK
jgi:tryptophan synthase alpha chain